VFVQNVEGAALAVVVPLMLAGFRHPNSMTKRMCSRIVSNMSKLVEDPLEALPFLAELIPALFEAIDTIADPEARDVAIETHKALVEMQAKGDVLSQTKAFRRPEAINAFAQQRFGALPENRLAVQYAAYITAALIRTNTTEASEYKDELTPYLAPLGHADGWKALRERALTVVNGADVQGEMEDDDEGEVRATSLVLRAPITHFSAPAFSFLHRRGKCHLPLTDVHSVIAIQSHTHSHTPTH
jgi:elongation factor 3